MNSRPPPPGSRWLRPHWLNAFAAVALAAISAAGAATPNLGPDERPLWLRYPAVSPDGREIVFGFGGNLFVVPATGGLARALTTGPAYGRSPIWSPDGRHIAYAADAYGNFDVFLVAAAGGPARRLTTHSAAEIPTGFTPDGSEVLFTAHRMDARTNVQFPSAHTMPELYRVSIEPGRRPVQVLTTPALSARYNATGDRLLYEDLKGYENLWRKHHVSPVAHDIWLHEPRTGAHTKLTDYGGEDREPVWGPDQRTVYFLSERSGSFNVWKFPVDAPGQATQVTRFTQNPVRFLSGSRNGDLCFGYDGEIHVLASGASAPRRVEVRIGAHATSPAVELASFTREATELAVSPSGKEIAVVVRGEIFVVSTEHGETKRVTNTPGQERSVDFSPDGRRLVFAGERENSWNLYEARLTGSREDQPYFFNASDLAIKTLLQNGRENFQPRYSPDGKEVAYLENRTTLNVLTLATGETRTVLPGEHNYSYEDGDQWFEWSPDGRWFLVNYVDRARWSSEAGLIDAAGKGPLQNLTKSGYDDLRPAWAMEGKVMVWASDRMGLHASVAWDDPQVDLYALYFTQAAYDRFKLSKAEFEILKEKEDKAKERKKEKEKETKADAAKPAGDAAGADAAAAGAEEDAIKLPDPLEIDLNNLENRRARLTLNSARIRASALTPDGETLVYLSQTADSFEVWLGKLREREARRIANFPAPKEGSGDRRPGDTNLILDREGKNAFVLTQGTVNRLTLPTGESWDTKTKAVSFNARMNLNRSAERAHLFEHVWRQTKAKFYVPDMHGVDWDAYRQVYAKFLPFITNNWDFAEMLSEMVGELNASHTGASYHPRLPGAEATAALGVFYDPAHPGAGVKIEEILEGGPLILAKSKIRAGMILEKIDGTTIGAAAEFDSLLNRKAGQPTLLTVFDPAQNVRFSESIRPISLGEQEELLYRRWVKTRREETERLSGGKIGYVHVRGMDDPSFRDTYSEVLGRHSGKQAIVVDTRFNGGGWLHDQLVTLLSGKAYLEFLPRGQSLGHDPQEKWTKPTAVLMSESNYSNAHMFPWLYRHLGLGKLVGMPVAGSGTAVWWEIQQDNTMVYGIPMVGLRDRNGIFLEHALVEPDVRVPADPAKIARGEDEQLAKAVDLLLGR